MPDKIKLAVNWAGACGGCDVAILDIEEKLLDLVAIADVVYWPVAMDFKREDLKRFGPGEIDVGIFNGVIRTGEHEEDARLMRERCKVLVAFGACAAFGGIPGLGNLHDRSAILDCAYRDTPSTENPEDRRPSAETAVDGRTLELPEFGETVRALHHVVEVDLTLPGCPPPTERILDLVAAVAGHARNGALPPRGTVIASDKGLCDECPRVQTRTGTWMNRVIRPHRVVADPEKCFLEQGILCLGIATRGGCGATCIGVNMPCRGCFGPMAPLLDPGAEALSAVGSIAALGDEDDLPDNKRTSVVRSIPDLAGTFYRFTLPSSVLFRAVTDRSGEPKDPPPASGKGPSK